MKTNILCIASGYILFGLALWLGALFVTYKTDFWIETQESRGILLFVWLTMGWVPGIATILWLDTKKDT